MRLDHDALPQHLSYCFTDYSCSQQNGVLAQRARKRASAHRRQGCGNDGGDSLPANHPAQATSCSYDSNILPEPNVPLSGQPYLLRSQSMALRQLQSSQAFESIPVEIPSTMPSWDRMMCLHCRFN